MHCPMLRARFGAGRGSSGFSRHGRSRSAALRSFAASLLDIGTLRQVPGVGMAEEGFEEVDAVDLIEAFARHLMLGVSRWQEEGAKPGIIS